MTILQQNSELRATGKRNMHGLLYTYVKEMRTLENSTKTV